MYVGYAVDSWCGCSLFGFISFRVTTLEMSVYVNIFSGAVKMICAVIGYLYL